MFDNSNEVGERLSLLYFKNKIRLTQKSQGTVLESHSRRLTQLK